MISGVLIGDKALIARLGKVSGTIKREVDATVLKLGQRLQANVQTQKLSGQVLNVRTNRLRSSIAQGGADSRSRFESTPTMATAYVGTNLSYGAYWEHGFTRKVGAGARGGIFAGMGQKALTTYFSRHPPGTKSYAARPFLEPALQDMRPLIIQELNDALRRGATQAMKS